MFSAIALSLFALATPGHRMDRVLTVIATDYSFDAPAQIPAGLTTIALVNRGHELHHVQLIRLSDIKTPLPEWSLAAGGPNGAAPGATTEATVVLEPGTYVMLCWVPGPDHVPHTAKGMARSLTVTPVMNIGDTDPPSDLTLTLTEYAFALSAPVTRGTHTLRVENEGTQPHEALLVRLAPNQRASDLVAWVDHQVGPPPAEPLGGLTMISHGVVAYFTQDFTPGRYAFLCFAPDPTGVRTHAAHGMIKEITVQ